MGNKKKVDTEEVRLPVLLENSAAGVKLTLGSETRMMDPNTVYEMKTHLSQWLEWYEYWIHYAKFYKDYSVEKVEIFLNDREDSWVKFNEEEEYRTYEIGENFASYLNLTSESGMFADNDKAVEIIKLDWEKEFPDFKEKLDFDPESSYCYVYTKDRSVASKFLWWSYNKYIKEKLKDFIV